MRLDVASATPSTRPRDSAPAFSTDIKNAGNADATISEEKSLKKLVRPRKKTLRGRPRILSFIILILSLTKSAGVVCTPKKPRRRPGLLDHRTRGDLTAFFNQRDRDYCIDDQATLRFFFPA